MFLVTKYIFTIQYSVLIGTFCKLPTAVLFLYSHGADRFTAFFLTKNSIFTSNNIVDRALISIKVIVYHCLDRKQQITLYKIRLLFYYILFPAFILYRPLIIIIIINR